MSNDEIDFLDGLDDVPAAPKPVAPAPVAVPVVAPAKDRETLKFVAVLVVCAACSLASGLMFAWLLAGRGETPAPNPGDYDPRFVSVGKAYLGDLGPAYGLAVEEGAKILDAGQTVGMALDTTAAEWDKNRKAAYNRRVTPELSKVVPQSKPDKDVTAEDRAALAKAYRGIAKGAAGK